MNDLRVFFLPFITSNYPKFDYDHKKKKKKN